MFASDLDAASRAQLDRGAAPGRAAQAAAVLAVPGRGAGRLDLGRHHRPARRRPGRGRPPLRARVPRLPAPRARTASSTTIRETGKLDDDTVDGAAASAIDDVQATSFDDRRDGESSTSARGRAAPRRLDAASDVEQEQHRPGRSARLDRWPWVRSCGSTASASSPSSRRRRSPGRWSSSPPRASSRRSSGCAASTPYARELTRARLGAWRRTPTSTTR